MIKVTYVFICDFCKRRASQEGGSIKGAKSVLVDGARIVHFGGRERVHQTQPPLFVPENEQLNLFEEE
jgi:hypothetical protein